MEKKNVLDRIKEISDIWFLTEPAYFMTLCTHKVEINKGMQCPIAVGGGYIYVHPTFYDDKSTRYLEESLKIEIIRILLKHPYQRQLPNKVKMYLSSNFVIANNTSFKECVLKTTKEILNVYSLDRESFEAIYNYLKLPESSGENNSSSQSSQGQGLTGKSNSQSSSNKNDKNKNSSGNGKSENNLDSLSYDEGCNGEDDIIERTQFWKEDEFLTTTVDNLINKISSSDSWGTVPGKAIDEIKKSIEPKFNYKALFQQFRSTVLSSKYDKTRMKPNRRFGYIAMGSKRKNTTKLLVAVDTSGSISDEELELALGFIKNFFKYAVERIDMICFDTKIYKESLQVYTKPPKRTKIYGRGGTDFNDIFKYIQEDRDSDDYSGVLILTDGYACVPKDKYLHNNYKHVKYLWVLNSEETWKHFKDNNEFAKFGKCTYVDKTAK